MEEHPLYIAGAPNPDRLGFRPVRCAAGAAPDPVELEKAAAMLATPVRFTDADGYEIELIAAVVNAARSIVYVRSRAKQLESQVDVEFRVHLRDAHGADDSWCLETYNPFFGCEVRFLQWFGESAVLIYREKHHTYACRIRPRTQPHFVQLADDWVVRGNTLAFWEWNDTRVSRMSLPDLRPLQPMTEEEASAAGLRPAKRW